MLILYVPCDYVRFRGQFGSQLKLWYYSSCWPKPYIPKFGKSKYADYLGPYLEVPIRPLSVWRCVDCGQPYMDRICRGYTPDTSSIPSRSSPFCSFWSNYFSGAFSYWALPLLPFPGGYGSWILVCIETGYFRVSMAESRSSSPTNHVLALNIESCVLSSSRAAEWPIYDTLWVTPNPP